MKTKLMALEALKFAYNDCDSQWVQDTKIQPAIAALEADIAKPVQPYGWTVSGTGRVYFSEHAEDDAKQEAKLCGGSTRAFPLYTTAQEPASGWMPDGCKLVPIVPTREMCAAAVKYANGDAVYKNVAAAALEIEEGIYGEAWQPSNSQHVQPLRLQLHFSEPQSKRGSSTSSA